MRRARERSLRVEEPSEEGPSEEGPSEERAEVERAEVEPAEVERAEVEALEGDSGELVCVVMVDPRTTSAGDVPRVHIWKTSGDPRRRGALPEHAMLLAALAAHLVSAHSQFRAEDSDALRGSKAGTLTAWTPPPFHRRSVVRSRETPGHVARAALIACVGLAACSGDAASVDGSVGRPDGGGTPSDASMTLADGRIVPRVDGAIPIPDASIPIGVDPCSNDDNPRGPVVDMAWPAESNVGHNGVEASSVASVPPPSPARAALSIRRAVAIPSPTIPRTPALTARC
jgi:hypothetical protein